MVKFMGDTPADNASCSVRTSLQVISEHYYLLEPTVEKLARILGANGTLTAE